MTVSAEESLCTRGVVLEMATDAWVPHLPATTYPRFQGPPGLIWVTLAHVVAIAVYWFVCHVGEATLRRRRPMMLAEVGSYGEA